MRLRIYAGFECPKCNSAMLSEEPEFTNDPRTLQCMNRYCEQYGVKVEEPSFEYKIVKERDV